MGDRSVWHQRQHLAPAATPGTSGNTGHQRSTSLAHGRPICFDAVPNGCSVAVSGTPPHVTSGRTWNGDALASRHDRERRRQLAALGADLAGLGLSVFGGVLRLTPLPVEAASVFTVIDNEPRLRRVLEAALGEEWTDLSLAVGNAAGQGLAHGSLGVLVDIAHRIDVVAEMDAQQRSLAKKAQQAGGTVPPMVPPLERPDRRTPDGPLERYAGRASSAGAAAASAALLGARSPRRAAAMVVAALPKAARLGREAFAANLGRLLAKRDVAVLDSGVLRRLDRVDTLVLPAELLHSGPPAVTAVLWIERSGTAGASAGPGAEPATTDAEVALADLWDPSAPASRRRRQGWQLGPPSPAERKAPEVARLAGALGDSDPLVLRTSGRPVAVVGVSRSMDESATRLVAAAKRHGLAVAIAGGDEALCQRAGAHMRLCDDAAAAPGDLATELTRMRADGFVVALVAPGAPAAGAPEGTGRYAAALSCADAGIELACDDASSWSGDLVVGSLDDARLVVDAVARAKEVSRQSVAMSIAGSSIAGLAALGGSPSRSVTRSARAVNLAAIAAMANGIRACAALSRRAEPSGNSQPWHQMPVEDVASALASDSAGIAEAEAARRRRQQPMAPEDRQPSIWRAMSSELANPLTPVLAAGAAAAAAVGSPADAAIVGGVSALNAVVGGAQRYSTERSIRRLAALSSTTVEVRRPNGSVPATSEQLVPGDVVVLRAGDSVPADCRVLQSRDAQVDESSLTGESEPVAKRGEPRFSALLAERSSMVYEGTTVAAGEVEAMVVATGADTAASSMAALVGDAPAAGGVEARLRRLTKLTLPASLAGGAAVVASGMLRARPARDSVGSGVALAVAAVPEGLPLLATMAQLASARRLSARGALVRNPRAVEALGRIEVLCTDKTGTLTEGKIRLRRVSDGRDDVGIADFGPAQRRAVAAALRASPLAGDEAPLPHLTDRAVVEGAGRAGVDVTTDAPGWRRVDELPFEPARGFHATLGRWEQGALISVKGAPETVLARCERWAAGGRLDEAQRGALDREVERLASQGLRVLAVAERQLCAPSQHCDYDDVDGLALLGFLALSDPVRASAERALAGLRRAGVDVVMVTGDHPSTARGIAVELGILDGKRLMTGWDLASTDDATLSREISGVSVFARVTPADKVRIVAALQASGKPVGMTGDGANDAPAIRLADAGIALGVGSTPAARRAADVVVTDGRIETIVDAVVEGRAMWSSVREAVAILVGGNLGEVLFTVAASSLTGVAPLSARQLLLVNLLTDVAPALAIALRPPPRRSPETLLAEGPDASLGSQLERAMAVRAAATAFGAGSAWTAARMTGSRRRASTTALVALVGSQLGQTLVGGGPDPMVLAAGLGSVALLVAAIQIPPVSHFLGCRPLGPVAWSIACTSALAATGASVLGSRLTRP